MKQFTIIKVGYTVGIYGCSGEYFTCISVDSKGISSFCFEGMYGAEERVAREMIDKGFEQKYTPSDYGKMTLKDIRDRKGLWLSEDQAVKYVKMIFSK